MSHSELVRKVIDAMNSHDPEAVASQYAPDAVVYDPYYPEPLRGRDAIRQDMADFFRAFPDMHIAVKGSLGEGNVIASEYAVSATHRGPLALPDGELPASDRRLEFEGAVFSRVNGEGLTVEEHRYYDMLGQLTQLGVSPAQAGV